MMTYDHSFRGHDVHDDQSEGMMVVQTPFLMVHILISFEKRVEEDPVLDTNYLTG